jgi:hypothetical protein
VPLIAVASKCNKRQENEIDESNVGKENMKDEYNETIADVDDGTMSEASDSERCEGVGVEEGVKRTVMKSLSDSFIKLLSFLLPFAISPVTFEVNMFIMEYFSLFYLKSHENIPLKNYN